MAINLREKLFAYRLSHRAPRQPRFPHWERVRTVLLLFASDAREENKAIHAIARRLRAEGKEVVLWGVVDAKEALAAASGASSASAASGASGARILARRDFGFWQAPRDAVRRALTEQRFDLLIDLTQEPTLPLRYLALYAEADFKVGHCTATAEGGDGLHDLLIQTATSADPTFLFEQILYYLTKIQSND